MVISSISIHFLDDRILSGDSCPAGGVRTCQWSKPTSPFNPVIRGCILLQLAFFQETLRQTNLRIEGEIEDLERERR